MVPILKIKKVPKTWNPNGKYKVGETIIRQNKYYQNTSGINSEPFQGSVNWFFAGNVTDAGTDNSIYVEGNPFTLVKNPANTGSGVEVRDCAVNGWANTDLYVGKMFYVSGNPEEIGSWNIVDEIEF